MDNEEENLDSSIEVIENDDSQNIEGQKDGEIREEYTEREREYYARIKKLEKQLKEKEAPTREPQTDNLSAKDFLALKDANITAADFDEVQEFARYKKISIAEALGNKTLSNILAERKEERITAQATETKSPKIAHKNSGEDILRKAEHSGEMPDSEEAMREMLRARLNRNRK